MATTITSVTTARPANAAGRRFGLLLHANLLMFLRNRMALFWNIVFPIGLMLLFGAVFGQQADAIAYLTSGMVVLSLMSNGIIGNASRLAEWRQQGILRRIHTTPLPVWQLQLSRIVVQASIMVVQAFLLVGTSVLVFGAHYDLVNLLSAVPAIIAVALLFMAFGQAIAALVGKPETVNIIAQVIYFPLMFLGNLMITLHTMPDYLQAIGRWLPSSMAADVIRSLMLGLPGNASSEFLGQPLAVSLVGMGVYFVVALFIATRFFKWS